jgi:hypothetical protein
MSSTGEKPLDDLPTKKSSDSLKDLGASGEKEKSPTEHAAVDTAPNAKDDQVPTVGFLQLFRCASLGFPLPLLVKDLLG